MSSLTCCVCHRPVESHAPRLGNRAYCAEHWAKLNRQRRSVWRSEGLSVLAIALFAVIVALAADAAQLALSSTGLILAGLVLAVIPAALWLAFFYAQDRLEPEPKTLRRWASLCWGPCWPAPWASPSCAISSACRTGSGTVG